MQLGVSNTAMNCKLGTRSQRSPFLVFNCLSVVIGNGTLNIVENYDLYVVERLAWFKYCRFVGNNSTVKYLNDDELSSHIPCYL